MKQKSHSVKKPKEDNKILSFKISLSEVEKKIRKPLPPATRQHRNKKAYKRNPKHPKQEEGS